MDGQMDGWVGGRMKGRVAEWKDGWIDIFLCLMYSRYAICSRPFLSVQAVVPNDQRYRRLRSNSVSEQITRHNPAVTATPEGLLKENVCGTQ